MLERQILFRPQPRPEIAGRQGVRHLIHLDPEGQVDQPDNPLAEADETKGLPQ